MSNNNNSFILSLYIMSFWKILVSWLLSLTLLGFGFADVKLSLDSLTINGSTGFYQWTAPKVTLLISNNGSDDAEVLAPDSIQSGFISCSVEYIFGSRLVFSSNPITTLVINARSSIQFPLTLSTLATSTVWSPQILKCTLWRYSTWDTIISTKTAPFSVQEKPVGRFDMTLTRIVDPLSNKLDIPVAELGIWWVKSWAYALIDKLAIPGAVFLGIFTALLALYRLMFKTDKDDIKQISGLIIRWIVWMILILSAKFKWKLVFQDILWSGEIGVGQFSTITIIAQLYDLVLYPFLKIFYYIAMWWLFIVLLMRVFSFVSDADDTAREKTKQIIISTVVWLLTIIGSKQLVEWVYGREADIRNGSAITVTDVWSSFLSDANIPILYTIIQWIMGLAWFAVLLIIVFQTFKMLTDPTNEENLTSIRKTIFYVVLGMLVIGAGYLIVNVIMIN